MTYEDAIAMSIRIVGKAEIAGEKVTWDLLIKLTESIMRVTHEGPVCSLPPAAPVPVDAGERLVVEPGAVPGVVGVFLSMRAAASALDIAESETFEAVCDGHLKAVRLHGRLWISEAAIADYRKTKR